MPCHASFEAIVHAFDPSCGFESVRAKFSGQVRDLVDLVMTRLSDIKGHDEARRRAREAIYSEEYRSTEASTKDIRCGVDEDLTSREVRYVTSFGYFGDGAPFSMAI